MQLVESANLSGGLNTFVDSFADKFVALLSTANLGIAMEYSTMLPPSTQPRVPLSSGMMVKRR
jgi:hypothetical protein